MYITDSECLYGFYGTLVVSDKEDVELGPGSIVWVKVQELVST